MEIQKLNKRELIFGAAAAGVAAVIPNNAQAVENHPIVVRKYRGSSYFGVHLRHSITLEPNVHMWLFFKDGEAHIHPYKHSAIDVACALQKQYDGLRGIVNCKRFVFAPMPGNKIYLYEMVYPRGYNHDSSVSHIVHNSRANP